MSSESKKWLRFRIVTLLVFFLVLFIALISRALQLQILSGKTLKNIAETQHTKTLQLQPERGIIFDRNGEKLAATVMVDSLCADPSKIADLRGVAGEVAPILNTDRGKILQKLTGARNFCWLARRIPPEQAASIEALDVEGLFLVKEPKRFYPNGELAGHLLGFVGLDSSGLEGLEARYDRYLKGTPGKLVWTRDAKGKKLFPRIAKASLTQEDESANIILTIDSRIQYLVESHLKEAVRSKGAKGGFAIVMDPKTGEILAMANEMAFDPNNFGAYSGERGKNKAITDCFDPGSTFKPFMAAGALEEGVAKETDRFYCENGNYVVGDRTFHEANRARHGTLTLHDIIKYSSNIGSIKIAERLGKEKFYRYIKDFGFGSKTEIDLPGESPGLLRPVQNWTRVDAATIAFGQGISVTAVQLITALSAIANKGVLMKPYVVRGLVDKQGQIMKVNAPTVVRRVVSPATAKRITAILTDVVGSQDGTGKKAQIVNVAVAGKTGTSQKFDFARHVYSSERVRTSFMGFFPADDPQIAILVILDEPQRDKWGGMAAAPVFKNIGEQILTCFKTNLKENPFPVLEEEKLIQDGGLKLAAAPGPAAVPSATEGDETQMPDFRGLTMREAMKRAKERGLELKATGSGWAVHQNPLPGASLGDSRVCTVTFSSNE